jgi:hypothetical protein
MDAKNNLTGRVFGKLTVIGPGTHAKGIGAKSPCRCSCGREETIWNHHLTKGRRLACGNCLTPSAAPAADGDFR